MYYIYQNRSLDDFVEGIPLATTVQMGLQEIFDEMNVGDFPGTKFDYMKLYGMIEKGVNNFPAGNLLPNTDYVVYFVSVDEDLNLGEVVLKQYKTLQ